VAGDAVHAFAFSLDPVSNATALRRNSSGRELELRLGILEFGMRLRAHGFSIQIPNS